MLLALVSLLAAAAPSASAHQYWLAPSRYAATRGAVVEVSAVAGTGFRGESKPWSPDHAVRFLARTSRMLDLSRGASPGDLVWARFAPSDDGGTLLAFESGFYAIELPAPAFDDYLAEEGLDGPLAARRRLTAEPPGRERYRRCAKSWLAGADASRAVTPIGQPLEVVPLARPGASPTLAVRVLWQGRPLAGARVQAWRTVLAESGSPLPTRGRDSVAVAWRGRTDDRGQVEVPVHAAGEWLVSVVHMVPAGAGVTEADWESTWASLAFERTADASSVPPATSIRRRTQTGAASHARPDH